MPTFQIGQRVRTLVAAGAAWPGAFAAPVGTLGTIESLEKRHGGYGVLLDGDPDALPASYDAEELEAAE